MNLNDIYYMSGDELMDQNSDGDEDKVVGVEDTLMSTAETYIKKEVNTYTPNVGSIII